MKGIVFLVLLCSNLASSLTNVEVEFITDFLGFLSRSNCVLVGDPNGLKHFTRNFISSTYVPERNLADFIRNLKRYARERITLVVKGHDLTTYTAVFDELHSLMLISQVTWITILNTTLDLSQLRVWIPYNSQFFLVEPGGENALEVREIFRERNVPKVYSNRYGVWSRGYGFDGSESKFSSWRRNLEGYPVTVVTPQKNSQNMIDRSLREIWFNIARYLNITTRLFTIEEYMKLGTEYVPWDVNLEMTTYDAFTCKTKAIAPIWKVKVFMHVRQEPHTAFSWELFLSRLWGSHFGCFIMWVTSLAVWLTVSQYLQSVFLRRGRFRLFDGVYTVFYWSVSQVGIHNEHSFSLLILIFMLRSVILIIHVISTGVLVPLLALKAPQYPFNGLEGLLKDDSYRLMAVNGSASQVYIDRHPVPKELVRKFIPVTEDPSTPMEAMEMLCADGKMVGLADNNDLLTLERKRCDILQIPTPVASTSIGIGLEDSSSFQFVFNSAFVRLIESGVAANMRRRVNRHVVNTRSNLPHVVPLHEVQRFFYFLVLGLILSLLQLAAERAHHALKSRVRKKKEIADINTRDHMTVKNLQKNIDWYIKLTHPKDGES